MTRDDIIKLAREAGFANSSFCRWSAYTDDLERFAALVAAAEREACAKVCDDEIERWGWDANVANVAIDIRARGETK